VLVVSDDEEERTGSSDEKPFQGVTLALTGVRDKVCVPPQWISKAQRFSGEQGELFRLATALGAAIDINLTTATTHLVAEDTTSAKYRVSIALQPTAGR
jgi:hypothetical protein